MRFPRTWELLRRARDTSHLELFRSWRSGGQPFPELARSYDDGLVADALAWEELSAEFDGAQPAHLPAPDDAPIVPLALARARGRVVRLGRDIPGITRALALGRELPDTEPVAVVVTPVPGGVRSDRIGADLARLHDHLQEPATVADLERETGLTAAMLGSLAASGLVEILPEEPTA